MTQAAPTHSRFGARIRPQQTTSSRRALGYAVVPIVIVVALWQLVTSLSTSVFFPTPVAIGGRLLQLLTDTSENSAVTGDLLPSVGRILLGLAIGSAWGAAVGIVLGLSRSARAVVTPVVEFLRSIPATAVLPLFIVLLGGGDDMRVVFIAYGVSWFVLINTAAGVSTIHRTTLEVGHVFRISPARRLFGIVLPAAAPKIFAGLRIASTAALLLAIVSELFLSTNGIGYQLVQAQGRFQLLDMWAWMIVLALIGLLLNAALEAIEGTLLGWHRRSKER